MTTSLREAIAETAASIKEILAGRAPVCGLILGSGLNFYADTLEQQEILPYKQLPHMKVSTATGHKGASCSEGSLARRYGCSACKGVCMAMKA